MKIKNYKIIFGFVLYLFSGSSFALDCDRALTELTERLSSFKDGEKIEENIIEVPQGFVIRRKYQLSNGLIIEIMSPEQFIISPHRCTDCRDLRHYKALQDSIQKLSVFLKTQYSRRENNFWTKDFTKKATDPKKLIERLGSEINFV